MPEHFQHPSFRPVSEWSPPIPTPFLSPTLPHGSQFFLTDSKLTIDADGHGVVHALPERLVLGLAHKHAAVVVGLDVYLQQADRDVPAKVTGLEK